MAESGLKLRALALCVLVLGLVAAVASAAHAEPGATWRVNNANLTEKLAPSMGAAIEGKHVVLLTKVASISVQILCEGVNLIGFQMTFPAGLKGKIDFSGCKVLLNEKVATSCAPKEGLITTNAVKGLINLHETALGEKTMIVRLEPEVGEKFVEIAFSEECAIGEKLPIIGKLTFKDSSGEFGVEKITRLIEEGPLSELYAISKTAEHQIKLDGSVNLNLTGAHAGMTWSGLPN